MPSRQGSRKDKAQIVRELMAHGVSGEAIKKQARQVIRRKRSWRPSEKALAVVDWDRAVAEVEAERKGKPREVPCEST